MRLNDYLVPQDELRVSLSTTFRDEDLSGETSSTATAHKGIKPKEINAHFLVRYNDAEKLTNFYRIAEATDDNGDLVIYDILERTANVANVRQVRFTGTIDTREIDGQQAWRVLFRLKEHLSTPEKTEQRKDPSATEASSTKTDFENVADYADRQLAGGE